MFLLLKQPYSLLTSGLIVIVWLLFLFLYNRQGGDRGDLNLDVFAIALSHGYDGVHVYVSPRHLHLACLGLCVACRNYLLLPKPRGVEKRGNVSKDKPFKAA